MDLDFFRKRKSVFMAALVVVSMFSFVILGSVSGCQGRGNPAANYTRLKVGGKNITEDVVQKLRSQRERARTVVQRLVDKAGEKNVSFDLLPYLHFANNRYDGRVRPDFLTSDLDGVSQLLALDAKAEQLGIEVSAAEARTWIADFTAKSLTRADLEEAFRPAKDPKAGRRASEGMGIDEFVEVMRRELRAQRTLQAIAAIDGAGSETPLDIQRGRSDAVNAEIQLELCRIEAVKLLDPKAEPPAGELEKLYAAMKEIPIENPRKLAGLRRPPQAEVDCLIVKPDALASEIKIDDKRCREYYDQHKEEFRKALPAPAVPAPPPPATPGAATPPVSKKTPPPVPMPPTETKPAPAVPAPPAEAKKAPAAAVPVPPAEAKKAPEPAPAAKKPTAARSAPHWSALVGVAIPQGDGKAKAAEPAKSEPKAEPKNAPPAPAAPKLEVPALVGPAVKAPPAKTPAEPIAPPPVDGKGMAAAADLKPADLKPFDDVKEEIRKKLVRIDATNLAFERLEKMLATDLKDYAGKVAAARFLYSRAHTDDDPEFLKFVAPPMPKPFAALAKEVNGEHLAAGMIDPAKAKTLPTIGAELGFDSRIFPDPSGTYLPETYAGGTMRGGGDRAGYVFLYWVGNAKAGSAPPLTECRDQLVAEWRKQDADKKAMAEAEKLLEKAKTAGSLAEATKGTPHVVFRPKAFTRAKAISNQFTGMQQLIPTATLEGVPDVDESFLAAAYDMEQGEVKALPGSKGDSAFLVKVVERKPAKLEDFSASYFQYRQRGQDPESRKNRVWIAQQQAMARLFAELQVTAPGIGRAGAEEDDGPGAP